MNDVTAAFDRDDDCDRMLLEVAGGDRAALGRLFEVEAGRLIAVARRIVRRSELAEEIVQEAFVSAWKHAGRFDPKRGRGRAWLTMIVKNKALNVVRDTSRIELTSPDELAEFRDRASDGDAAYTGLAASDALRRCLDQLEPERRRSVLLSYVVGHSHGEIASELAVPVGTVKAWIRRSVIALQDCLS